MKALISPGSGLSGLVILMLSVTPCIGAAAENDEAVDIRLWYQKPAGPWEEAVAVYFRWDLFGIFGWSSRLGVWTPVTTRISGFGN
jgi:hypothetical protein